ncbi:hypothetical protein FA10DRAFT_267583 [Acaromyces ingoldii]|uniref:DUF4203 domain-containing protein n=1 Tax=Acaromyces ingoldii TaxID=215250 RepID=A0A316YLM9_9BASI|nr:hypothetical protein FA10DRAFT_267583 [Acaromyces ingoldii]PWN88973.1 hypothetical protein FA10DRAFT_267583 [Acaromyces ingoldii]
MNTTSDKWLYPPSSVGQTAKPQFLAVNKELEALDDKDKTYNGFSSEALSKAFADYVKYHPEGVPKDFDAEAAIRNMAAAKQSSSSSSSSAQQDQSTPLVFIAENTGFSWADQLHAMGWAKVLYGIVWMVVGLVLLFFGLASLFWLNKLGTRPKKQSSSAIAEALPGIKGRKRGGRAILNGGVGGLLIGFLFFSYLAVVINNAVCADDDKKPPSAGALFAVWLAPGLLGAVVGGHLRFASRAMAGVLGGTSLTIILTAVFGIRTILIRVILLAVFSTLLTAPLILPRPNAVQKLVLNGCTSLVGVVTFLNGVALFAPPRDSSDNWLDLWVVLFAKDKTSSMDIATSAWGTSAFKGYIAGAVLGAVVGFLFEMLLHKHAGEDAESEWNQYLGSYTERFEKANGNGNVTGADMSNAPRAGLFEPAPSAWQRMCDFFDSASPSKPASYGNLTGDDREASPLQQRSRNRSGSRRKGRRASTRTTTARDPARFEALSGRDQGQSDSDDDSDATDVDDVDEKHDDDESKDLLSPLSKKHTTSATENYGGYQLPPLPRPPLLSSTPLPSYRSEASDGAGSKGSGSNLSGTTARGSDAGAPNSSDVHKPLDVYRDSAPSSPASASPAAAAPTGAAGQRQVAATPSLINAISRIQQAQAQARAWQEAQDPKAAAPYGSQPTSPR